MLVLVLVGFRTSVLLAGIVPFYFIRILFTIAGHNSLQPILSVTQRYMVENIVHIGIAFTDALQLPTVQKDLRHADIGVDRYRSFLLFTIHIAPLGQVQDRFLTPIRLILEVGILPRLTVESHQAFHVTSGDAPTVSHGRSKIKHIP